MDSSQTIKIRRVEGVQCTVHVQWRLAGVEGASEVPEEDSGKLCNVVFSGPAQEGLAGEGQVATGVDSQGGGAGGVVLLQGVVTQQAVLVPADGLLRAGREGGESQAQPHHHIILLLIRHQFSLVHISAPTTTTTTASVNAFSGAGKWKNSVCLFV